MASVSYRLESRESKQSLRAILTESNASLDWDVVEAEFDQCIALEKYAKGKGEVSHTPGGSSIQDAAPGSTSLVIKGVPGPGLARPVEGVLTDGANA